jgi:hypothetical protein
VVEARKPRRIRIVLVAMVESSQIRSLDRRPEPHLEFMNNSAPNTRLLILLIGLASLGVGACTGVNDFVSDDGAFPEHRAAGMDCANASPFQVHAYDEDFYVIRQSMCLNYEALFLFLFIGEQRALLMDTGAVPDPDVYGTVMEILERRADELGSLNRTQDG